MLTVVIDLLTITLKRNNFKDYSLFASQFSIFSLSVNRHQYRLMTIIKLSRYLIIVISFSLMTTLIYLYIVREEIMKTLDIFSDYL